MAELRFPAPARRLPVRQQLHLGWAFVERQTNLWKRHWAWEVVWLVYGVVNTLAITFIAKQLASEGIVKGRPSDKSRTTSQGQGWARLPASGDQRAGDGRTPAAMHRATQTVR